MEDLTQPEMEVTILLVVDAGYSLHIEEEVHCDCEEEEEVLLVGKKSVGKSRGVGEAQQ